MLNKAKKKLLGISMIILPFLSPALMAADWYGFCYGKLPSSSTICSTVEKKTSDFTSKCKTWALKEGADTWGNFTGTNPSKLKDKQKVKCDQVKDPAAPVVVLNPLPFPVTPITPIIPGTIITPIFYTYDCMTITTCPGADGTASSQSAEIVGTVSAFGRSNAITSCVRTYPEEYLTALEEASKVPLCHFIADVQKH